MKHLIAHLTIVFSLASTSAFASEEVASPCAPFLKQYAQDKSIKGKFISSKADAEQSARTWILQSSRPKSQGDDRRSRAISLEDASQCLGILKGDNDPTDTSLFPSGELSLDSFKLPDGTSFLLVHSNTFRHSFLRESHLVYFNGGSMNSSLKRVWSAFTESSSPSGEEEKFEMKTSAKTPKRLELNGKKWTWDNEKIEFSLEI